jgi:hypothetical protein
MSQNTVGNAGDITAVEQANDDAVATMTLLAAEAAIFALEMQGLNAEKDAAKAIQNF